MQHFVECSLLLRPHCHHCSKAETVFKCSTYTIQFGIIVKFTLTVYTRQISTTIYDIRRRWAQRVLRRVCSFSDRQRARRQAQVQRALGASQLSMPTVPNTLWLRHQTGTVRHRSFPDVESSVRKWCTRDSYWDSSKRSTRTHVIWRNG